MRNDDTPRACSRCGLAPRRAPDQRWCHACTAADAHARRVKFASELRFLRLLATKYAETHPHETVERDA